VAAALALLCSAGAASAQESKAPPCDLGRNAALIYWRAFAAFPEEKDQDLADLIRPGNETKLTPEQKAGLAKRWDSALELLHEAADIPQCNWGLDFEKKWPKYDFTYLTKARTLARAAAFRAGYFWQEGKRKEAADDFRAAVIMAHQVGNEGHDWMIGVLVQDTTERILQRSLAALLTDRESADVLADALGNLVNGSPAPLSRNAILAEKKDFFLYFPHAYSSDPAKTIAGLPDEGLQALLREVTSKQVLQALDEIEKQYDELAEIHGLPLQEFLAKEPAMEEKIIASKNPFEMLLQRGMKPARLEEEMYRMRWAMIRAAIAIRRDGQKALGSVLDPSNGKPFEYTALEGGAFELKSATIINYPSGGDLERGKTEPLTVTLTFGHAAPRKN
jgi:hypothetical protein